MVNISRRSSSRLVSPGEPLHPRADILVHLHDTSLAASCSSCFIARYYFWLYNYIIYTVQNSCSIWDAWHTVNSISTLVGFLPSTLVGFPCASSFSRPCVGIGFLSDAVYQIGAKIWRATEAAMGGDGTSSASLLHFSFSRENSPLSASDPRSDDESEDHSDRCEFESARAPQISP